MTNEEIICKLKEECKLRGFSHHTQDEYLGALRHFLKYYENRQLENMGEKEIRQFLLYLIDSEKSSGTVNINNSALRFIYGAVLERSVNTRMIPRQRDYREFPDLMSKTEIMQFFSLIDNLRDRTMFETIYGSGLRISEIVKLRVQDIDSKQMRIYVQKGKDNKDRYTLLSQRNLELLREYWKQYRPNHPDGYLFYARSKDKHPLTTRSVMNAFIKYRTCAGLSDEFTSHTLRHCFATHLLEAGMEIFRIKELLGHTFIQTTAFYLHLQNIQDNVKTAAVFEFPTIPAATAIVQNARP